MKGNILNDNKIRLKKCSKHDKISNDTLFIGYIVIHLLILSLNKMFPAASPAAQIPSNHLITFYQDLDGME